MPRRSDYPVGRRDVLDIAETATRLRVDGKVPHLWNFPIVPFIMDFLIPYLSPVLNVSLEFFVRKLDEPPAEVIYSRDGKSAKLRVSGLTWQNAKKNTADARYILAHEIGHLVLHRHEAKSYSNKSYERPNYIAEDESAECQAHAFARLFLVSESAVDQLESNLDISTACNVDNQTAQDRIDDQRQIKRIRRSRRKYEGESCRTCGNFTMVRAGLELKCDECGDVSDQDGANGQLSN